MDDKLPLSLKTCSIVVVDDSQVQRQFAVDTLRGLGVERVAQAADGQAALSMLQSGQNFAVVLVDLEMPGMDGVELIHHIARAQLRPAIIVASSRERVLISSVGAMVKNLGLPLLGVLQKPLSGDALLPMLQGLTALEASVGQRPESPSPLFDAETLRCAIDARQVVPFFQPKANMQSGAVFSLEALARWWHNGACLSPSAFMDQVEAHGLMGSLTLSILDQTIEQLQRWQRAGLELAVAINLSPASLEDMHLADSLIRRTEAAPLQGQPIMFEVTESAMPPDESGAIGSLLRLRLRGFELAIDDYGTGFSSMQQLSRLPFSELKIDRSFVSDAHRQPRQQALLESAIDIARRMGLRTVAEGIECAEEWALLKQLGCDAGQGYLVARPVPGDQVAAAIAAWSQRFGTL